MTTTINHSYDEHHHAGGMEHTANADPEVPERTSGPRRFPAGYKAQILTEYETLDKAAKGACCAGRPRTLLGSDEPTENALRPRALAQRYRPGSAWQRGGCPSRNTGRAW